MLCLVILLKCKNIFTFIWWFVKLCLLLINKLTVMKATVKYENGWILKLPTTGNAPMLFLEWISEFRSGAMPVQKVVSGDFFGVRFHTITKKDIEKCVEYINANL